MVGSKAGGPDTSVRVEDRCVALRRQFERRVKDRPTTDPSKIFWNSLLINKDLFAKWLGKMKQRDAGIYISDVQMISIINEFKRDIEEVSASGEWYSFLHATRDYPLMEHENQLKVWEKLCGVAKKQKEIDGRLHIAKPPMYSNSKITQSGVETAIERNQNCNTAAELEKALEKNQDGRASYWRALRAERVAVRQDPDDQEAVNVVHNQFHMTNMKSSDARVLT